MRIRSTASVLCLLLALLLHAPARAQADFRPGYIIEANGDTVRGLADYRGARRSSLLCQFQVSASAPVQTYRPAQLRGYGFPGVREFRSLLTPLPDSAEQPQSPRLFFLEVLASGEASLYARRDYADATYWYLQKKNNTVAPVQYLEYHRMKVNVDGREIYRDYNTFRSTLSVAFADCPSLSLDVLRTEFLQGPLVRLVNRYNACRQPAGTAALKRQGTHASLGALVGFQTSRLTFDDSNTLSNGNFTASPAPVVGLALQVVSPGFNEKLMLRIEALYSRQEYRDEYTYISPYFHDAISQAYFKLAYLRVPVVLRYTLPRKRVQPILEAGITLSQALRVETGYRIRYLPTLPYEEWEKAVPDSRLRSTEVGVMAGAGVQLPFPAGRPLSVLGRIERSNGIGKQGSSQGHVWRYQLLVGINLTK